MAAEVSMSEASRDPLEEILHLCARFAPAPWYPRISPVPSDFPRDRLDTYLERLRLGGLIALTEWMEGRGQGYVLTSAGKSALDDPEELQRFRAGKLPRHRERPPVEDDFSARDTFRERVEAIRTALTAPATPVVTFTLIALNVMVYLLNSANYRVAGQPLSDFLALRATDLVAGDWRWLRLLSCCFVHAGALHLFMNMYGLYVLGPLLERMWSPIRFLLLYLIAGLGGSCVAMALVPSGLVGASGAIWGVMVSLAVWVFLNRHFMPPALVRSWANNLLVVFGLNVAISFLPHISWAGHFGGGAVGGLCALLLHYQRHGSLGLRLASLLGLFVLPFACLGALYLVMNHSSSWQNLMMLKPLLEKVHQDPQATLREKDELRAQLAEVEGNEDEVLQQFDREVIPMLERHPSRRKPEAVAAAIHWLSQNEAQLKDAMDRLRGLDPFPKPAVEQIRQDRIESLRACRQVFEGSRQCLQEGKLWTEEDELTEVWHQVHELDKRWHDLLER